MRRATAVMLIVAALFAAALASAEQQQSSKDDGSLDVLFANPEKAEALEEILFGEESDLSVNKKTTAATTGELEDLEKLLEFEYEYLGSLAEEYQAGEYQVVANVAARPVDGAVKAEEVKVVEKDSSASLHNNKAVGKVREDGLMFAAVGLLATALVLSVIGVFLSYRKKKTIISVRKTMRSTHRGKFTAIATNDDMSHDGNSATDPLLVIHQ
eukprot:TRINITY_DN3149_c0_g1_i1.p1 TRINITY_DN3149_c0_g1~~TRINITY_DN3149_c0_g1_i1.p1  ORF type:complete len:213 (-),score=75.54 TRINITY_DN3149_c0_g1_i1:37-675(-)